MIRHSGASWPDMVAVTPTTYRADEVKSLPAIAVEKISDRLPFDGWCKVALSTGSSVSNFSSDGGTQPGNSYRVVSLQCMVCQNIAELLAERFPRRMQPQGRRQRR
jgi:hypothetical protein